MIEFTCSCGKKYRQPPRNAGREVRCNQCEKTLIVPKQSQTEPVAPLGTQSEPVAEPKIEPKVEPKAEPKVEVPEAAAPIADSVAAESTPFADSPTTSTPDDPAQETPSAHRGTLVGGMLVFALVIGIVGLVIGRFSVSTPPSAIEYVEVEVAAPLPTVPTADDWTVSEDTLPLFAVRTADGASATLALDGDPTAEKSDTQSTLDHLAIALDDDQAVKGSETHTVSFRVDSESGEELCVVWPASRNAGLDEAAIKELKFCLYFGTANVELADFRLRIGDAFGDTEFVLTEKERTNLCEKGRITWFALSVPIDGNDRWQRTERGRMKPKTVDFIELRAKPTGNGVTFWIDNLNIVH